LSDKPKAVVALSGGVDSSVAAALLVEQGYEVTGMMMRLWSEPGNESTNRCCTPDAMSMARRVALRLGIPFYAVNAQEFFHSTVVNYFIEGYLSGDTPNPCLTCNRQVRWQFLLERALAAGANFMATGHYSRLRQDEGGRVQLLRGVDQDKDQSYVLHVLGQAQLVHALFPLGEYTKPEVRELARRFNLPVAERSESQDLCFLGSSDYRSFLQRHAPQVNNPGPILTRDGLQIGEHQGLPFYTIGQRKGLGLASPQPLYVLEKDGEQNALIVGAKEDLGRKELLTGPVNWISGEAPDSPTRLQVKIRYKAREAHALVQPLEQGRVHIVFDEPQRDITPGQAAVLYEGEQCLGGGIILSSR
jgi:tRNA-uridine 2-sulfurtransferase